MKNILITGASSGIGAALALAYAEEKACLFLSGRDETRLKQVAEQVIAKGGQAHVKVIDVTDAVALRAWIENVDDLFPLDLVIANAGISAGTGKGDENEEQIARIFATNVHGVFHTVHPIIPRMKKRKAGQIAIMASLAGFFGIPGAPTYAASKAAVRVYGEGLRGDLAPHGVKLSVICPGFVKTPMTAVNNFKMPFLMSAERAAQIAKKGLEKNKARIAFPQRFAALIWLVAALPPAWTEALFARLPRK